MATDIKKLVKNENLILGSDRVIKGLRNMELEKAFLASNAPKGITEDVKHFAAISKIEVEVLEVPNDELGVLCKKPFSISCIGIKKAAPSKKKH